MAEDIEFKGIENFLKKLSKSEGLMYFLHKFNEFNPHEILQSIYYLKCNSIEVYNDLMKIYNVELTF